MLLDRDVHVHEQVADAGAEVVQESPDQAQRDQLDEPVRGDALEVGVGHFGTQAQFQHVQDARQQGENDESADTMQDRDDGANRHAVVRQFGNMNVTELRPFFFWYFFYGFRHNKNLPFELN